MKMVGAAEFKATCLKLIDEMRKSGEPITITKRGKPVAVLNPSKPELVHAPTLFGFMKGSVLKYERPFDPAVDPEEWDAVRGVWEPHA